MTPSARSARFLLVFFVRSAGEEAVLEFLLGVVKFDDNEAINVLGVVYFFGIGQAGLFQDPVVVLIFGSLLHSQHVSRAKHGTRKFSSISPIEE